ncbi:catalase family peroxidase [Glaciecola sp. KUL10]|uniref:catalase family peroxidase n=1 Tax=Glaciecola sp. (strain KUL10) TaxID=2161813 RepID=UPI0011B84E1D|nr:catalase family peroxidase [Glaciecola sp. KUL10]
MNKFVKIALVSLLPLVSSQTVVAQEKTAVDMINLFEKLAGKQPGFRKAHARGVCASGEFMPNKSLSNYSTSELFKTDKVPATIRFSLGGGNPMADERAPGARGMAIQLKLPSGAMHNIVGNSTPVFAAKDPDTFFGFLETLIPGEDGKVDMRKVGQYVATHPSTQPAAAWQRTAKTPYSYANTEFFGLHTFFMNDSNGNETKFRWHTTPDLGVKVIEKEALATLENGFLEKHLTEQFANETISYTISISLGRKEDTNIDPSQAWPADRPTEVMGKLTLTSVGGKACDSINFDPNVISAGFKSSDDPVLRMRSPAYAVSFGKRLSGQ